MLLTIGVLLTTVILFGLAWFVLARNSKSSVNRSFGIFTLALTGWVLANYIGANFKSNTLSVYFLYGDFLLGPVLAYLFWYFSQQLRRQVKGRLVWQTYSKILLGMCTFAFLLPLTGSLINTAYVGNTYLIEYEPLYDLYSLVILVVTLSALLNIVLARREANGRQKAQLSLMLGGLVVTASLIIFANFITPQLTESETANLLAGNLSYLGVVAFVGLISYAIVKHRLFDVRLIVARSLAYVLVILSLSGVYASLIFSFSALLQVQSGQQDIHEAYYVLAALFLAITFQPLKSKFDTLTDRIFYRDAYDPQVFIDELNKTIVSTIELRSLLDGVSRVIESNIKASYVYFLLNDTSYEEERLIGLLSHRFDKPETNELQKLLKTVDQKILSSEDLAEDHTELYQLLRRHDVALVLKLMPTLGTDDEALGLLIIGDKKSGNLYTSQDIKMLHIIANELVIAIQNALRFEEIEQFNITLQQKVDDATRRLRQTNEKLKALDETKDEFISMASHQLRTPLTSVKGYISMVMEGDAGKISTQQKKLLDQAFVSSQRMVYLIADLLNVSRLKTGKFVIEAKPTNLAEVVQSEIGQLTDTAKSRDLELSYDKPDNFPSLMLDDTKVRQVIMNFIDNAIYYTPSGGHIQVALKDGPAAIEFTVTDDGIGVPKDEQHQMFSKFYRAANAKKARPDGTGLGLFMAKKVIIAQGGSTIFHSQEGTGSTFGFTFPKAKLQPPTTEA